MAKKARHVEVGVKIAAWSICFLQTTCSLSRGRHGEVPQLISELGEAKAWKEQFEQEIKQNKVDRMVSDSGEMQTNIAAMGQTYDLTRKGKGSNLLQTTAVSAVRRLGVEMDLSQMDKGIVSSFLPQAGGFAPASGQIMGISSGLKGAMEKDLADLNSKGEAAKVPFEEMIAANSEVIQANSEAIVAQKARHGEVPQLISELG